MPAKVFRIDCEPCEAQIFGGQRRIKKHTATGGALEWEQAYDPLWSRTIEGIPLTPDQEKSKQAYEERGSQERDQLQTLFLARMAGMSQDTIPNALESGITGAWAYPAANLAATRICKSGHQNAAGSKWCSSCGVDLNARPEFLEPAEDPGFQGTLPQHEEQGISALRNLCKDRGLSSDGTHSDLAARLTADDKQRYGVKESVYE